MQKQYVTMVVIVLLAFMVGYFGTGLMVDKYTSQQQDFATHSYGGKKGHSTNSEEEKQRKLAKYEQKAEVFLAWPKAPLTQWEKDYLTYRIEEEKLARDVYETLSSIYNSKPFTSIRYSEQGHINMMKVLRDKYEIPSEYITSNQIGVFVNPKFQKLYDELVAKGKKSLQDALEVGMIIEDIDLADLDESYKKAQNPDLKYVLETFIESSSHHMQAFYKRLQKQGLDYTPQHISKERMQQALAVPKNCKGHN